MRGRPAWLEAADATELGMMDVLLMVAEDGVIGRTHPSLLPLIQRRVTTLATRRALLELVRSQTASRPRREKVTRKRVDRIQTVGAWLSPGTRS